MSSLTPSSGSTSGGTNVTITGTGFTTTPTIKFGSSAATIVTAPAAPPDDTSVVVRSPAGSGTVQVSLKTAGGTTYPTPLFSYLPPPIKTSLSTSGGPAGGGNPVTISGQNLANATSVQFGAAAVAPPYTTNNAGTLVLNAPAGTAGTTVGVTVTTNGGSVDGLSYTYYATPTAANTTLSDSSGPQEGGNSISITNTTDGGLSGTTGVSFGTIGADTPAPFVILSDSDLGVFVPAGTGTQDVNVFGSGGNVTKPTAYTYTAPPG